MFLPIEFYFFAYLFYVLLNKSSIVIFMKGIIVTDNILRSRFFPLKSRTLQQTSTKAKSEHFLVSY